MFQGNERGGGGVLRDLIAPGHSTRSLRSYRGTTLCVGMKRWWAIASPGVVLPVEPDRWLLEPGDWGEVEAEPGTPLPADYKALIGSGLACVFGQGLVIWSPFDPNPNLNLIRGAARCAWALAVLREGDRDAYPSAVYPEPAALLTWGTDGGGGDHHWDTSHTDPDHWTVAVSGRPVSDPSVER